MKKSKIVSLALAGTLTVTALIAGTYAWTSISQRAVNESKGSINPGARLHDDFDGINKDIYVENFTSNENGEEGAVIYARIKLAEYLKIGNDVLDVSEDGKDTTFDDLDSWAVFKLQDEDSNRFRQFFEWTWGNEDSAGIVYMPTFNKNKDSLEAEINGTYAGTAEGPYKDHVGYTADQEITSLEIYDADEGDDESEDVVDKNLNLYLNDALIAALHDGNGVIDNTFSDGTSVDINESTTLTIVTGQDEDGNDITQSVTVKVIDKVESGGTITEVYLDLNSADGVDEADVKVVANATHKASTTLKTERVITMEEWLLLDTEEQTGPYWVYDTDGWAYWAQGIQPGTATGCLLTGIERTGSIVDQYHYAINVTAEFATAGDWGEEDDANTTDVNEATGFQINTITNNGLYLLNTIAGGEKDIMIEADATEVERGGTLDLSAIVTLGLTEIEDDVIWSVSANSDGTGKLNDTGIVQTTNTAGENVGRLTIGENETARYVYVKAALANNDKVTATKMITIKEKVTVTVSVDGEELLVPENKTVTLTASVKNQWGDAKGGGVTWSLEGTYAAGTEIETDASGNGVLTAGANETATSITVVATSNDDKTATRTYGVPVTSQLEYLDNLSADAKANNKLGLVDTTIKIDGINWYVLAREDIAEADGNTDGKDEVLLWATQGVKDWGGPGEINGWAFWSEDFPFESEEVKNDTDNTTKDDAAKRNWWKYSNARAWLNYSLEESVTVNGTECTGFLTDKEILRDYAAIVSVMTKKEFSSNETVLEENYIETDDKIFLLTQADIYGHTSDASGNSSTNLSSYDYTVPGMATGSLLQEADYVLDGTTYSNSELMRISRNLDNDTTLSEWSWLRSPCAHASNVAGISTTGGISHRIYTVTAGRLRPALWMNLTSSTQGEIGQ